MICEAPKRSFADELRHGNVTISGNVLSDVSTSTSTFVTHEALRSPATPSGKATNTTFAFATVGAVVLSGNVMDRNERYHYGDGGSAQLGVVLSDCTRCTLSANVINGVSPKTEAAIDVTNSDQINIVGCTIADYPKYGVRLSNCGRSMVDDSLIAPANDGGRQILRITNPE